MKSVCKGQGKAIIDISLLQVLKAVLWYKDEALQFKKFVWALHVKVFKKTFSCSR